MLGQLAQRLWFSRQNFSFDEMVQFRSMARLSEALRFLHESDTRSLYGFLRRTKNVRQKTGGNGEVLCLDQRFGLIFEYEEMALRLFLPQQTRAEVIKLLKSTLLTADVVVEATRESDAMHSDSSKSVFHANDRGFTYVISVYEDEGASFNKKQIVETAGVKIDVQINYRKQGEQLRNDAPEVRGINTRLQLIGASTLSKSGEAPDDFERMTKFGELFQSVANMAIKDGSFAPLHPSAHLLAQQNEYLTVKADRTVCEITCVGCRSDRVVHILLPPVCKSIFGKDVPFHNGAEDGSYYATIALPSAVGDEYGLFVEISDRQTGSEKTGVMDCRLTLRPNRHH